jgi:hypothetical protein
VPAAVPAAAVPAATPQEQEQPHALPPMYLWPMRCNPNFYSADLTANVFSMMGMLQEMYCMMRQKADPVDELAAALKKHDRRETDMELLAQLIEVGKKQFPISAYRTAILCKSFISAARSVVLVHYEIFDEQVGLVYKSQQFSACTDSVNIDALADDVCEFCKNCENVKLEIRDGRLFVTEVLCLSCSTRRSKRSHCRSCREEHPFCGPDAIVAPLCKRCHECRGAPARAPRRR